MTWRKYDLHVERALRRAMRASPLSDAAVRIGEALLDHMKADGTVWADYATLAHETRKGIRTIGRAVDDWKREGFFRESGKRTDNRRTPIFDVLIPPAAARLITSLVAESEQVDPANEDVDTANEDIRTGQIVHQNRPLAADKGIEGI